MDIDKKLEREITEYCKVNGLNKKEFVNQILKKAFIIEKYGEKPFRMAEKKDISVIDNKIEKKSSEEANPIITKEENKVKLEIISKETDEDNKKNCIFKTEEITEKESKESKSSIKKNKRVLA